MSEARDKVAAARVWLMKHKPEHWMSMIDTADTVAKRYEVAREAQDEYALSSQMRTAALPPRRPRGWGRSVQRPDGPRAAPSASPERTPSAAA